MQKAAGGKYGILAGPLREEAKTSAEEEVRALFAENG